MANSGANNIAQAEFVLDNSGYASPESTVSLTFRGQTVSTTVQEFHARLTTWMGEQNQLTNQRWLDFLLYNSLAVRLDGASITGSITLSTPAVRDLVYDNIPRRLNIPPLAMLAKWHKSGQLADSALYICKALPVALTSPVEVTPWCYSNIFDNGHTCWGSTRTDKLVPTCPAGVLELFFTSGFNNHLWRAGEYTTSLPKPATPETVVDFPPVTFGEYGAGTFNRKVQDFFGTVNQ